MSAIKRYYLCDFKNKVAISYDYVPEVWGQVNGMLDLPDELLADLTWASYPDFGFIPEGAAALDKISEASRADAYSTARLVGVESLRAERDVLLADSDKYVMPDRWESYTPEKRAAWTKYRATLRDLPITADAMNYIFPTKPV